MTFKHKNHSWSLVVTRGHSWSLVCTFRQDRKADSSSKSEAKHGGNWSILARHSQSLYLRGQNIFYIFLYFSSKNLVKTDEIWMKSWILVFCLGSILNFNYYLFKRCDISVEKSKLARDCCFCKLQRVTKQNRNVTQSFKISLLPQPRPRPLLGW
jgi:hypothetical protein